MRECFDEIFNTNPIYSTSISFIVGLLLIDDLTAYEQNVLGNWLILVGQTILTNAASQMTIETRITGKIFSINSKKVKSLYFPFKYDIKKIREIINITYPNSIDKLNTIEKTIKCMQKNIDEIKKNN